MPTVRVHKTFRRGDTGEICRRDTVIDVPADMAKHLIAQGYAEAVQTDAEAEATEVAQAEVTPRERSGRRKG